LLINWITVAAQIVNFLVLVFLLKRFLFRPILNAIENREKKIAAVMEQAKLAEKKASQLERELAVEKRALLESKQAFLENARQEVQEWREKTLSVAQKEVETLRRQWVDSLNLEKEDFFQSLRVRIIKHVMNVGDKVLSDLANESLDHQVARVFMDKIRANEHRFQSDTFPGPVTVYSGFDVSEALSEELRENLLKRFPKSEELIFKSNKELGIGLVLVAGDIKVEWNLSNYLGDFEKEIFEDLAGMTREKT
jgi:F-type H+-transporting ATPase subunit b